MFVIYDREIPDIIYGITETEQQAKTAKAFLVDDSMAEMLRVDPMESGIYWENWSVEQKQQLKEETTDTIGIVETKLNTIRTCTGEEFYV